MISAGTMPIRGEKSALAGNSGTPGSGNKYVTETGVVGLGGWTVHVTITGNTTLDTTANVWPADATGGAFSATLPTAVGNTKTYTIKKIDASANAVTVATTSAQTIDGVTTQPLSVRWQSITVISDGANWLIL